MKAMVFAAGVGSRLKALTQDTPKCLMRVGGSTILEHVINRLKVSGVTDVAINVHHHADKIIDFIQRNDHFDINIHFSHEEYLLDTGGGLKRLESFFEGERAFIIHNSDIYSSLDLSALVRVHLERNAIGTLAIMNRPSKRGLYFDKESKLTGWTVQGAGFEASPHDSLLAFCGISVASAELFQYMGEEEIFSLILPYLRAARASARVWGEVVSDAAWTDIGTPEQLAALNLRLQEKS